MNDIGAGSTSLPNQGLSKRHGCGKSAYRMIAIGRRYFIPIWARRLLGDFHQLLEDLWVGALEFLFRYDRMVSLETSIRRPMRFVETRFRDSDDKLLIFALTSMRWIPMEKNLGDA